MKKLMVLTFLIFNLAISSAMAVQGFAVNGPNSINAAMLVAGLVKTQRFSSSTEIWTILNSAICRQLESTEAHQARDLGIIIQTRNLQNSNAISHAFVQINKDFAYEKIESDKSDGYQVGPVNTILQRFASDIKLTYYRCQPIDQFLMDKKSAVKGYTKAAFSEVEAVEANLQRLAEESNDSAKSKNKYLEIERQMQIIARKLSVISDTDIESDLLISKIIAGRYVSIAAQIKGLGQPELADLFAPWEFQDKDILNLFNLIIKMRIQDEMDLFYSNLRAHFVSVYGPIVKSARNVPLNVSLTEEYPDNVGGVSLYKNSATIQLGYDLHHSGPLSPDAYSAILCHEVGHLLGGRPFLGNGKGPQWVSDTPSASEGQSDYFSSLACMKKIFAKDAKETVMNFDVTPEVKGSCKAKFPKIQDQNICQRSIRAGYELMDFIISVFEKYQPGTILPRPNMNIPEGAGLSVGRLYPSFQCRFDTIKAGALNEKRPACWYNESL